MIQEDYVSYEIAKLLKEKGFDGKCLKVWIYSKSINLKNNAQLVCSPYFMEGELIIDNIDINKVLATEDFYEDAYLCPTLQMAMKWLREVYKLSVRLRYDEVEDEKEQLHYIWFFDILSMNPYKTLVEPEQGYYTYEEACEAAIKYCLENLI